MGENASTNVKIKLISSIIPTEGELETYEMWLEGQFIIKNGTSFLRYAEVQDDKTIQTTIKLVDNGSFILRSGAVNMRMPLNTMQEERGHYESNYGSIPLVIKTHEINCVINEQPYLFKTNYDLIIGGASVGNYTLEIKFSEVQS